MRADVALLAELDVDVYSFSVAWPRVQPDGAGPANEAGLDFYRSLVDELLAAGITPFVTLYHWDLPQACEDAGGWPDATPPTGSPSTRASSPPRSAIGCGAGRPPTSRGARRCSGTRRACTRRAGPIRRLVVAAAHHLLLGHGLAVDAMRAALADPGTAEIGLTLNPYPVVAAGERDVDRDAARRVDGVANRLWYDAVLLGRYPDDVLADFATVSDLAHIRDGDLAQISRPIDALGLDYYRRYHVRHAPGASARPPAAQWPGSPDVELVTPPGPLTSGGWAIEPDGLYEALVAITRDYDPPPLYIHENGAAFSDAVGADGIVDDADRIVFLDGHLRAAHRAIAEGVDLIGYFVWSFLDNFEWAEGYAHRFGIVHVDYDTLARTPKASARWFARGGPQQLAAGPAGLTAAEELLPERAIGLAALGCDLGHDLGPGGVHDLLGFVEQPGHGVVAPVEGFTRARRESPA